LYRFCWSAFFTVPAGALRLFDLGLQGGLRGAIAQRAAASTEWLWRTVAKALLLQRTKVRSQPMARPVRQKKFIDPRVQGSLVRRLVFHWMVFMIVTALASFVLLVLSNPFQPLSFHVENLTWTHGPLLLVMFFMMPVFVVDTIKLSHRFTGPIFALRRAMREVTNGQPPRQLKFRSNDFWQELAEEYNALLAKLGARVDHNEAITDDEQLVTVGESNSAK
jgi:hypothetical protein